MILWPRVRNINTLNQQLDEVKHSYVTVEEKSIKIDVKRETKKSNNWPSESNRSMRHLYLTEAQSSPTNEVLIDMGKHNRSKAGSVASMIIHKGLESISRKELNMKRGGTDTDETIQTTDNSISTNDKYITALNQKLRMQSTR